MTQLAKILLLSSVYGLFIASHAQAAAKMKPGLWEMSMQSDALKAMPKMPPEQLEQIKKMGIKMPMMQDGAMKTTVCISKEMAEQDHPAAAAAQRQQPGCTPQNIKHNGNEYSMDLICDGPELKGVGKVKGSYNGSDSVRSSYDFKGTSLDRPVTQHMESAGKWLSSDCGNVKPMNNLQKNE